MHGSIHSVLNFGRHTSRFTVLPPHLRQFVFARLASSASANAHANGSSEDSITNHIEYPFPKHPHPTPYEIFHLKPGALPGEIKARYYQLVRIHHPDAHRARRLPSNVSHARFQAIQAAHDVLTGKTRRRDFPSHADLSSSSSAMWGVKAHPQRRTQRTHNAHAEWAEAAHEAEEDADDRWKDQTIVLAVFAAVGLAIIPFVTSYARSDSKHMTAAQNLAEARREARELGMTRRAAIRKHVRSQELEREYEERLLLRDDADDSASGGSNAPG